MNILCILGSASKNNSTNE